MHLLTNVYSTLHAFSHIQVRVYVECTVKFSLGGTSTQTNNAAISISLKLNISQKVVKLAEPSDQSDSQSLKIEMVMLTVT